MTLSRSLEELNLVLFPSDLLVSKNMPLKEYAPETDTKVRRMFDLLYRTPNGVGLAAPQVGWNVQLFVLNLSGKPEMKGDELVFWNPTIVRTDGPFVYMKEGCLSFPGITGRVKRHTEVELSAQTPSGPVSMTFEGLGAQAVQHEMDHLGGVLFIEKMSYAERREVNVLLDGLIELQRRSGSKK